MMMTMKQHQKTRSAKGPIIIRQGNEKVDVDFAETTDIIMTTWYVKFKYRRKTDGWIQPDGTPIFGAPGVVTSISVLERSR